MTTRKIGEGRNSVKIEIIKGVTESDAPYMVMVEGVRADPPQEFSILKAAITVDGAAKYFKENAIEVYGEWLRKQ